MLPAQTAGAVMPRFHFNIHDGVNIMDEQGIELANWHEARIEAVRYAGDILKSDAQRVALHEDWFMEVTDDKGLVLFRLDFRVLEAPAMLGSHRRKFDPS